MLLSLASVAPLPAVANALEIIRRAVAADECNWKIARNYGFSERVDARRLNSEGGLKSKDVKSYDVMLLEGSPYRRLVGRDDLPLGPGDEKKEQAKIARSSAERRKETAPQRTLRLAEYERRPEWQREVWRELPKAFDFRLIEGKQRDADSSYVIEATPRQGYKPRSSTQKVLAQVQATLWVDKQDYHLLKVEVEVIDAISIGLFLVRLAKGARADFEQARVNNEVWLPQRVRVSASARVGLLKVLDIDQEVIYSKWQRVSEWFPHGLATETQVAREFDLEANVLYMGWSMPTRWRNIMNTLKTLSEKASEFGKEAVRKLDEVRDETGGALHNAAATVRTTGRQGSDAIENLAASTAARLDATAAYIEDHDLTRVYSGLRGYGRRHMAVSMLAAAAIGFLAGAAISRLTRSRASAPERTS